MTKQPLAIAKPNPLSLANYIALTKPGILMGNLMAAAGGFLLASKSFIDIGLFFSTLLGLSLVIASACVFNNWIDTDIDEKMTRTKNRPLVQKIIPIKKALIFGTVLGLSGIAVLISYTNSLTAFIALMGFAIYVVAYTKSKRLSTHGTLIGSIAGATPPLVGYCAVTNQFDVAAFILFSIMTLWQMPHFYAIAMYRLNEYEAASIPVLPLEKGTYITKVHMLLYIVAFIIATSMLTIFGYTGYLYLTVMTLLGTAWFLLGLQGFRDNNDTSWARKMFLFSLVIVVAFCAMIAIH